MSVYVGMNRRSRSDRRVWDTGPDVDRRGPERRRHGTDEYVLVAGDGGVDRFALLVGFPVACLIAVGIITTFAKV